MNTSLKLSKQLSFGEEIANSVTHAVGAVIMLILLPISSTYSYETHGFFISIGVSIFVISLFLMFLSSPFITLWPMVRPINTSLRIIDHSMIYVAIAGSYTPVVLTLMNNWFGYLIIAIQWGTTIFGILYKIFAKKVNEKFSLALYLIMGWLVLAIIPAIISQTTPIFWESHGHWRTLLYSWSWILRQEKTLFPHDLASLYPSSVRTPIHCHCLLHVKKLRNSISTFFFTHIDKVLVQAHIISQFRMKKKLPAYFFLGLQRFDYQLLLEFLHLLQHY